jgi:hypothetical protein
MEASMKVGDLVQYIGDNSSPRSEDHLVLIGVVISQRLGKLNGSMIAYQQVMWSDKDFGTVWLNPALLEIP